jgi:HEPN domain-containing protein
VEKSLKAILAFRGVDYPYSHDLDGLLGLCRKHEIEVSEDLSGVGRLSVFGVALRYGSRVTVDLDRDQALRWAATAVEWARQQIESTSAGDTTDPQ